MKEVVVIDALRTPIGKYGGALSSYRPDDLAALVIQEIVKRNPKINTDDIEDVIFGAANQSGEDNRNVARMAALLAGLPTSVGGITVNRLCASGLQSIMDASRAIQSGDGVLYLAGGVESMSRAPFVVPKHETPFSRQSEMYDTTIGWRFINKKLAELYFPYSMGETAENVAKQWKITREQQDEFAFHSQKKYEEAHLHHKFKEELIAVELKSKKGEIEIFAKDEYPRLSSLATLATLKPAFLKDGTVTAGNSSGINDGAAALIIADADFASKNKCRALVKIKSMAIAGVEPAIMGIGPVPATKKALKRAHLTIQDIGLIELNEAFASQSIACIQELELNPELVNVNGGAIALGHPLGCSGARISTTLIHEMKKRKVKFGLATMCIGVGQGAAIIYENIDG